MTPQIRKILYASDLSPNSAHAMGFALNAAHIHRAEIIILHVFYQPTIGHVPMIDLYLDENNRRQFLGERADNVKQRVRRRLEIVYAKELRRNQTYEDIKISIEICDGYPAETILRMAETLSCDMIIMGTHGKGVLGHAFLGSTAKRVLRRTRKPVFIIPLPKGKLDITIAEE